jgi:hypothetical protein
MIWAALSLGSTLERSSRRVFTIARSNGPPPTIVPAGFLALGVTRRKGQFRRSSYVLAGLMPLAILTPSPKKRSSGNGEGLSENFYGQRV